MLAQIASINNKLLVVCLLVLALAGLVGCGAEESGYSSELSLDILGDIQNPLSMNSLADAPATLQIKYREKTIDVVSLDQLVQDAGPYGANYQVLYIAHDGFSAHISSDNLTESYLTLNRDHGWEAINLNHPVSSNIKHIKDIVIFSEDIPADQRFNIIAPGRTLSSISIGEMYRNGYSITSSLRGSASITHEGEEFHATTYYRYKTIDIEDYVSLDGRDSVVVVGSKGEVEQLRQDGRFILNKNSLDYMAGDEVIIPQAKGIIVDTPDTHITDVYYDIREAFDRGSKILVILVDGLGYHQYEYASTRGLTPFMQKLPEPQRAVVAYPSVTPVNMAASLSGELPHVNGVFERGIRQSDSQTIFGYGVEQGKTMTAIIGPIATIELEIDPIFTVDENNDGSTDDEKTEIALNLIGDDQDLMFVHYKNVDKTGHTYGGLHENTLEEISRVDAYLQELVLNWQGKVLIYSDHGMYDIEDGGDHGAIHPESMFTPYWLFDTDDLPPQ